MQCLFRAAQVGLGYHELIPILIETVLVDQLGGGQLLTALVLLLTQRHNRALPVDVDAILTNTRFLARNDGVVGFRVESQQQLTLLYRVAFLHCDTANSRRHLGGEVHFDLVGKRPGGQDARLHFLFRRDDHVHGSTGFAGEAFDGQRHGDRKDDESGCQPTFIEFH